MIISTIGKLKHFLVLFLEGMTTLLEDLNIMGVKAPAQDIEDLNNLDVIQMKQRWNNLVGLIRDDMNLLNSYILDDDATWGCVLFILK